MVLDDIFLLMKKDNVTIQRQHMPHQMSRSI